MHAAVHVAACASCASSWALYAALRRDGQDGAAISQYRRARSAISAPVLQGHAASRCTAASAASHRCCRVPAPAELFMLQGCAAVRSQRHRSAIIALPVARGILRLAALLCAELLAQSLAAARGASPRRASRPTCAASHRALPIGGLLASLQGILRNSSSPRERLSSPASDHAASRCTAASSHCCRPATDAATRPSRLLRARSAPAEHLVLRNCAAVRLLCATASDATARLCATAAVCGETRALLRQSSPPRSWTDACSRHCGCSSCSCCCQSCARPLSLLVVTAGAAALMPPSSERKAICSRALLLCGEASAEPSARVRCCCP
jgi:hypothetical protein